MKMQSINPYTGELMEEYALMTKAELDRAVQTSRTAFRAWRVVPVEERATHVKRMGEHHTGRPETSVAGRL